MKTKIFVTLISILILTQELTCKGFVEINLKSLDNPHHFDNGKECCDTWPWKTCRGQCDTKFVFCITDFGRPASRLSCNLGKLESKVFSGQSSITFKQGDDLGHGLKNPLLIPFQTWQKFLEVMITTYDDDSWPNSDDLIDIHSDIVPILPSANSTIAKTMTREINGRVSLIKFDVKVYCDDKYEGSDCGILKKK